MTFVHRKIVDRVHRPDLFREVARSMGVETPREDLKKETLFDGIPFDPPSRRGTREPSPCTRSPRRSP
jgi:hypothetical protein